MPYLRLISAFGVLFSISLFISSNLEEIRTGSGYFFLGIAGLCFGILIIFSGNLTGLFQLKRSTQIFFLFFVYFGLKYFFESGSPELTKEVLIGTSGGTLFALSIGLVSAHALATIYELRFQWNTKQYALIASIVYFSVVLFLSWLALQTHMNQARGDLFLLEDQEGFYQRAGDLATIQITIVVSLATILFVSFERIGIGVSVFFLPIVLATGALTGLMSQVVGSNSGMVASAGLICVFIVNYVAMAAGGQRNYQSIELTNIIFGPLGRRIAFGSLLAITFVAVAAYASVKIFGIHVDSLRISGFGTGEISSVESRSQIFRENFLQHLEHSPIFGNTQVENLTTGEGTYVHSLLALFTHLGIVGASIFIVAVFLVYVEIVAPRRSVEGSLFGSRRFGLFRLMMLAAVVLMCLYSAFFTWMPMWFAFGLFGEWHYRR